MQVNLLHFLFLQMFRFVNFSFDEQIYHICSIKNSDLLWLNAEQEVKKKKVLVWAKADAGGTISSMADAPKGIQSKYWLNAVFFVMWQPDNEKVLMNVSYLNNSIRLASCNKQTFIFYKMKGFVCQDGRAV